MYMKDSIYSEFMSQLIDEKKISIDQVNDAVSRVLRIKFRLGLFDNPYTTVVDEKDRYLKKRESSNCCITGSGINGVIEKRKANFTPRW